MLASLTCTRGGGDSGVGAAGSPGVSLGLAIVGDRADLASSVIRDGGGIGGLAGSADAGEAIAAICGEHERVAALVGDVGSGGGGVGIGYRTGGSDSIASECSRIAIDLTQIEEFCTAALTPAPIVDKICARPLVACIF